MKTLKRETNNPATLVPVEAVTRHIYLVRGHKVMLDTDLAKLYGVETFNLNKAVKRNRERFPEDFMFQLTKDEIGSSTFQTGMSKRAGRGGRRTLPHAFTEQGVAMLSSVLRSRRSDHAGLCQVPRNTVCPCWPRSEVGRARAEIRAA